MNDNEERLITGPCWIPSDWLTIALIVFLILAAGVVYYTTGVAG